MSSHAIVRVILRSGKTIDSPIMSREEAEKDLGVVNTARAEGSDVSLSWLSVSDHDIEAAHLVERAGSQ